MKNLIAILFVILLFASTGVCEEFPLNDGVPAFNQCFLLERNKQYLITTTGDVDIQIELDGVIVYTESITGGEDKKLSSWETFWTTELTKTGGAGTVDTAKIICTH